MQQPTKKGPKLPLILAGVGGVLAIGAFVTLRVLLHVYRVPSGGMLPTIGVGDRVLAKRLARTPRRGDVIVFEFPENRSQDFIKRVIALGGDVLEVKDGHPVLNGWPVPSCKVGTWSYEEDDGYGATKHTGDVYVEYLEDAAYLTFHDASAAAVAPYQGPYRAKAGEAWVMGDNRNNSHDSRMWFGGQGGGVPADLVRGTVILDRATPSLPSSMDSLRSGLAECLKARPPLVETTPPPPRP